jgi:UPF0755 protein
VIAAAGVWIWAGTQLGPASAASEPVAVTVPRGASTLEVANRLQKAGLIRNARLFAAYARLRGDGGSIKAGEYRIAPSLSAAQVLDRLKQGGPDNEFVTVTIPEGFTLKQIAERMKEKGVIQDSEAFLKIAKTGEGLTAPFDFPKAGLEGYLYPDTYRFKPNTDTLKAAQVLLDGFTNTFYDKRRREIDQSGHSLHELVTIASLIEREAEVDGDRPRIAGVIENRLKKGMRLEIDATVIYALGRHVTRVLYRDLRIDSPYNTYRNKGLPPGPIAAPGLASLEAALKPESHDYLFYVARPDGSHAFARTMAEHSRNVARMRAERRGPNPGSLRL